MNRLNEYFKWISVGFALVFTYLAFASGRTLTFVAVALMTIVLILVIIKQAQDRKKAKIQQAKKG